MIRHSESEPAVSAESGTPDQSQTEPTSEVIEPVEQVFRSTLSRLLPMRAMTVCAMAQYFHEVEPSKTNSHTAYSRVII